MNATTGACDSLDTAAVTAPFLLLDEPLSPAEVFPHWSAPFATEGELVAVQGGVSGLALLVLTRARSSARMVRVQ